jgi:hypothetical protein
MGDSAADKDDPLHHHINPDNAAGNAGKYASHDGISYKFVLQQFHHVKTLQCFFSTLCGTP